MELVPPNSLIKPGRKRKRNTRGDNTWHATPLLTYEKEEFTYMRSIVDLDTENREL